MHKTTIPRENCKTFMKIPQSKIWQQFLRLCLCKGSLLQSAFYTSSLLLSSFCDGLSFTINFFCFLLFLTAFFRKFYNLFLFSIPKHRILNSTILIPFVIDLLWFSLKDTWVQFDFSNTFQNIIFISDFTVAIHFMISPFRVTFSKIHGTRILISCWLEKNNSLM